MRKCIIVLIILMLANNSYAYFENYPPYEFNGNKLESLMIEPVVDLDKSLYKSDDQAIEIVLSKDWGDYKFYIKDNNNYIVQKREFKPPLPHAVYQYDLDRNKLNDFIVIYSYRGNGLAAYKDYVEIYLNQKTGKYVKISFDTMAADIKDFVDIDGDGIYEVIMTGFYYGVKHNYFTYNVYEFIKGKLVNADNKLDAFPKFIWYTDNPNDKNTTHLTDDEKQKLTEKRNKSIKYENLAINKAQGDA